MFLEQERIGSLIKQARKKYKLTQGDLADKLEVSQDTISSYEKGKIKVIPYEKRVKLSRILDIDRQELLYQNENFTIDLEELRKRAETLKAMTPAELKAEMHSIEKFAKEYNKNKRERNACLKQFKKNIEVSKKDATEWFQKIEQLPADSLQKIIALEIMYDFYSDIVSGIEKYLDQQEEEN